MVMGTWVRSTFTDKTWVQGYAQIANIPEGDTLLRVRFGWGVSLIADTRESALNLAQTSVGFGILTASSTVSTDDLPNPQATGVDPDPPVSRFTWWEQRQLQCTAYDSAGHYSFWKTSEPQSPCDSHGEVLANVGSGNTLKVYAVWGYLGVEEFTGEANIWCWASVLYD